MRAGWKLRPSSSERRWKISDSGHLASGFEDVLAVFVLADDRGFGADELELEGHVDLVALGVDGGLGALVGAGEDELGVVPFDPVVGAAPVEHAAHVVGVRLVVELAGHHVDGVALGGDGEVVGPGAGGHLERLGDAEGHAAVGAAGVEERDRLGPGLGFLFAQALLVHEVLGLGGHVGVGGPLAEDHVHGLVRDGDGGLVVPGPGTQGAGGVVRDVHQRVPAEPAVGADADGHLVVVEVLVVEAVVEAVLEDDGQQVAVGRQVGVPVVVQARVRDVERRGERLPVVAAADVEDVVDVGVLEIGIGGLPIGQKGVTRPGHVDDRALGLQVGLPRVALAPIEARRRREGVTAVGAAPVQNVGEVPQGGVPDGVDGVVLGVHLGDVDQLVEVVELQGGEVVARVAAAQVEQPTRRCAGLDDELGSGREEGSPPTNVPSMRAAMALVSRFRLGVTSISAIRRGV